MVMNVEAVNILAVQETQITLFSIPEIKITCTKVRIRKIDFLIKAPPFFLNTELILNFLKKL
jgi:hypothetical protein